MSTPGKRAPAKKGITRVKRTASTAALGASVEVAGAIVRVLFARDGFVIAALKEDGTGKRVVAKGPMGEVEEGQHLVLRGEWVSDPRYGEQLKVSYVERAIVGTPEGIKRFLMVHIKGIGEKTAEEIVARFGERTFDMLEQDPAALSEVGIGPGRAKQILNEWRREKEKGGAETMAFLLQIGIGPADAQRVYARYGEDASRILRENPYILMEEVERFGFKKSDEVARHVGVPADSPFRIRAGVIYALGEAAQDGGHCYLPKTELVASAGELLGVEPNRVLAELPHLTGNGAVVIEDDRVYSARLHRAETAVAERLGALLGEPRPLLDAAEQGPLIDRVTTDLKIEPSREQREAVLTALREKLVVVTGGPGTGKTTIIRTLCTAYDRLGLGYILLTPTGKAAKRLAEVTGRRAATIHRYLHEIDPEGRAPIPLPIVIVDEVSMLDIEVAAWFLRRLNDAHRLVLVGDVDQLPSVGPGAVLNELITSGVVPTIRLTEVFRQALDSGIVLNAHRINRAEFPKHHDGDCEVILKDEVGEVAELVRSIAARERAIVLTPMRPGEVGVATLNQSLQDRVNPAREGRGEHRYGQTVFRVGDPVIFSGKNDYQKGVFNGEVGEVVSAEDRGVVCRFDERDITFLHGELGYLQLCYAITVHKAQGSEYDSVVIPCVKQHFKMLARNLLYTAVTRARRRVYLVGQRQAIWIAVKNDRQTVRNCFLGDRLRAVKHRAAEDVLF